MLAFRHPLSVDRTERATDNPTKQVPVTDVVKVDMAEDSDNAEDELNEEELKLKKNQRSIVESTGESVGVVKP